MWAQMGFGILDFWNTTPYEFSIIIEGYSERRQQEYDAQITQAYLISRWVWAKKLPGLEELLNKKQSNKEMTDDQMFKMAMALNKMFGGNVVNE